MKGNRAFSMLIVVLALCLRFHHNILAVIGFTASCLRLWRYYESEWYVSYLRTQWAKLPLVDPTPVPEIWAENFTKELLWEVSNNLRSPVVIRGAITNSTAVKQWGKQHFLENYADELIVVREVRFDSRLRLVRVPMRDFWNAFDHGVNVSIIASSSIFERRTELKEELAAPFQADIRDREGHAIFAHQLFVTPGGRSFYHAAIGGNVFRQVSGRKSWTVVSPRYSRWLCPFPVIAATSVNTCVMDWPANERETWFSRLPRQYAMLEPGDIFYNPPWYWHDVITVGDDVRQASVAGRIRTLKQSFQNAPVQSAAVFTDLLLSKLKGKARHADEDDPSITVASQLEDNIIASWTNKCLNDGFTDCTGLPGTEVP